MLCDEPNDMKAGIQFEAEQQSLHFGLLTSLTNKQINNTANRLKCKTRLIILHSILSLMLSILALILSRFVHVLHTEYLTMDYIPPAHL